MHLRSRFDTMPRKDLQSYNPLQPGVSGYKTYTLLREFITKQNGKEFCDVSACACLKRLLTYRLSNKASPHYMAIDDSIMCKKTATYHILHE